MRIVLKLLLMIALSIVIAVGLLVLTPLGVQPLAGLFPVGELEPVDFATLELTENPNQHLMCPPDLCTAPHATAPAFEMPVEALRARWEAVAESQPRVEVFARDRTNLQVDYVQRSARFRFPDVITVRFIPISNTQSTLAIYSRSIYGKSDLGVNRERIETWMERLTGGR